MSTDYSTDNSLTTQVAAASLNLEQSTGLIVERAKQLVSQLIYIEGSDSPPLNPEKLASLKGVREIIKTDLGETGAILLRLSSGYIIKVNKKHHPVKQRFSCAHEIGHVLLDELEQEYILEREHYVGNPSYRFFGSPARKRIRKKPTERLCDVAATELLMPEMVFKKYLTGFGVSVHAIERLANIFRVSISTTAIRIAELSTEPCLALLWRSQQRARSKGLRLAWCVGPGRNLRGKGYHMPLHTYVRPPSTLHKAYQYDSRVKCHKLFKLDTGVKRLPMESKGFGRNETRYVISLAFPDRIK